MKSLIYKLLPTLFLWATACSKVNDTDRQSGQDDAEVEPFSNSNEAQNGPRPRDEGVTPDDYVNADLPNAVTGVRLAGIEILRQCIKTQHGTCNKVQLTAMVTAIGKAAVLYDAKSKASLGIQTATWEVSMPNATCVTEGFHGFKPLCHSNDFTSLATGTVTAKLELKSRGVAGSTIQSDAGEPKAAIDALNITLTPASAGLTPSGILDPVGYSFDSIWQDQVTGTYLTNLLTGTDRISFGFAIDTCEKLDSGDGLNKWTVPSALDFLNLYDHGILKIPSYGVAFEASVIWTATGTPGPLGEPDFYVKVGLMSSGGIRLEEPSTNSNQVFCIRK